MGCFNYICPICNTSIRTGATSGIIAIHDRCYNQNESVQKSLPFSAPDPNQGCGPARKKFV